MLVICPASILVVETLGRNKVTMKVCSGIVSLPRIMSLTNESLQPTNDKQPKTSTYSTPKPAKPLTTIHAASLPACKRVYYGHTTVLLAQHRHTRAQMKP